MANEHVERFVRELTPLAVEIGDRYGIDPALIITQSAIETGWGRKAPGNNFFGVKSHGQPGGQMIATHEEVNGRRVPTVDSFRQYGTLAESMEDYARFLSTNPRYADVFKSRNLSDQITAIADAGYATDSNYGNLMKQVSDMVKRSMPPLPPGSIPQVATALDVINRAAPMPAMPSSALGYARSDTPAGMPIVPVPMPRPERQRTAPTPATQSLPMQSIRAANSANRPELQAALQSYAGRSSPPTPATPSWQTNSIRSGRVPLGNSINNSQAPVGLMNLASSPNAATPSLQADGSVRSPMSTPPMPASVEQRVTARNNPPPMPPVPRSPPPRSYGQSSIVQDSFAALPSAARPDLQAALNNYAGNGIGSMPSMGDMAAFSGADIPDRLPQGSAELPGPWTGQPTQVADMPPLPQPRPLTGIGGPLPPIAPPMPPTVQPVAPVAPPVPQPRLQRPGIFGKPMIGNWEVPLPGIFGGIQNFTAAMNNASGPFNNGFDNLLSTTMRGGNFLAPGAAVGQAGGFLYARNPGGGFTNVGRVDNSLTPAQRYDALNRRQPTNAADRMRENSRKFDSDTPQSLVG